MLKPWISHNAYCKDTGQSAFHENPVKNCIVVSMYKGNSQQLYHKTSFFNEQ